MLDTNLGARAKHRVSDQFATEMLNPKLETLNFK